MRKFHICAGILLLSMALLCDDSYSELMDRAEKLTAQRYEPNSRAFKIKSKELDEILDGEESREEKIRQLKEFIAEMEKILDASKKTESDPKAETNSSDPLKTEIGRAHV